ncbi:uncharacterized protein P884DRAFT_255424 [Thermothelomyces heterothallicus CBS 202.75]|uniref:uncharacterized protein n=1 Tax=Thermothelomyces heterothallicus CBS 202.75 TaxID=1149848 RepID=UPI0037448C6F
MKSGRGVKASWGLVVVRENCFVVFWIVVEVAGCSGVEQRDFSAGRRAPPHRASKCQPGLGTLFCLLRSNDTTFCALTRDADATLFPSEMGVPL